MTSLRHPDSFSGNGIFVLVSNIIKHLKMKFIPFLMLLLSIYACQKEQITIGTNANDVFFLQESGGVLPIQVHGNTASKKMLVIVHGGPGDNGIGYRDDYVVNNVEKEFAVAYWDQRFAGSAQGNPASSDISTFKTDLKKVLQLLKSRYGNDTKMYLMGHSWGGFLAPYFLEDGVNQDLVKGWIQVDGAHNYFRNDSLTREMLLLNGKKEIAANRNSATWQEIVDYCNAHAYNESFAVGRQLNSYASVAQRNIAEITTPTDGNGLFTPSNNIPQTAHWINIINSTFILKIDQQAYAIPISENLYKIKIPTLLLWGRYDFVCPTGLASDIKKNVGSSDVSEKIFEKSGHSPMINEPEAFWNEVINWVKKH
jgi:pimeloyl-ACP methyl ester carboxylesterase